MIISFLNTSKSFCFSISSKKSLLLEAFDSFEAVIPFQFLNFLAIAFPIFFGVFITFSPYLLKFVDLVVVVEVF
jgi:hypothetical protein